MRIQHQLDRTNLLNQDGQVIAFVSYPDLKPGVVRIDDLTVRVVQDRESVLDQLMYAALEKLRQDGKQVILTCAAAQRWFQSHPQYKDRIANTVKADPSY